jgi:hypothetical protein
MMYRMIDNGSTDVTPTVSSNLLTRLHAKDISNALAVDAPKAAR